MKLRNTLILFGVVIILFIFVYFFEIRKPKESAGKGENLGKKIQVEQASISKLQLAYSDPNYEEIVCYKDNSGQWQIERPIKARADQKIMDRIVSGALDKTIQTTVKNTEGLSEYGLDKPRVTATFYLQDGKSRTIELGGTVPTGNYAYIKQKASKDIYLVPAVIVDDLTKFAADLRDRAVMAFDKLNAQKIQLKYADKKSIICEKKETDWNLVEPIAVKADINEVQVLLSDLEDLKADEFVDKASDDLSVYGLAQPQVEVIITLKDGTSKTLLIGKRENDLVYTKIASDSQISLVSADIVSKLSRGTSDLRDKTIIAFDKETAEKLEIKKPVKLLKKFNQIAQAYPKLERSIVLEKKTDKDGETWEITAPIRAKADKSKIETILQKLLDLKAEEFVSDRPRDLAQYGFAQIQVIVSSKSSVSKTLLVGRKSGNLVYVKTASAETVYLVDGAIADELNREPYDLRDQQVMKFKTNDVMRIQLKRKDKTIVCIRQEYDWRIVEPIKEKAKNYEVNDILNKLADLKAERFVKATRLSDYGLDQPMVEATLTFKDNSTKKLLAGSKLQGSESSYAKTGDEDVIFVIEKSVVDALTKDVADIREKTQ